MIFEIFIVIATILTLPGLKIKKISYWLKFFLIFLGFLSLGALIGYFQYGKFNNLVTQGLILDYYFLITSILGFLLVVYYQKDKVFLKRIGLAFLLSLASAPLLFFNSEYLFLKEFRFVGLHTSPTVFGSLLVIPFSFLLAHLVKSKGVKEKIGWWLLVTLTLSLMFATGTRAAWLAAAIMIIFLLIRARKLRPIINIGLWSVITIAIAFLILPDPIQNMIFVRIFPQYIEPLYVEKLIVKESPIAHPFLNTVALPGISQKSLIETIRTVKSLKQSFTPSLATEDRQHLAPKSSLVFLKNPLGLGTQFYNLEGSVTVKQFPSGAHNTFLSVALSGGIGALIMFVLLFWKSSKSLRRAKSKDTIWLGITLALIGLIVIMLFDDRLFIPWFWLIPAMAIAWPRKSS
tara:strand:+ start:249 stop:1460 length:1212 start_codon:yes stop_codon:yes gene_type:complete